MRARTILGLIAIAAVAVVAVLFWPANLGGRTTYVGTHGTSMEPRFHAGDLALVRPASSYKVGDIIAYHSNTLHATVMHRIIADSPVISTKGDHNNFVDIDHPTQAEIIGKLAVRIPKGAAIRALIAKPVVLFPFLTIAIVGAGSGFFVKRSRRRKGERVPARMPRAHRPQHNPQPVPRDRVRIVIPIAACLAALGCLVATAAAWQTPEATAKQGSKQRYDQNLALTYSGVAPQGAAYPDGVIHMGDTVYEKVATRVNVNLASDLSYHGATRVDGTYDIVANVTGGSGMHGTILLASRQPLTSAHAHVSAPLDIKPIRDLLTRFANETGLSSNQAAVDVVASIHLDAVLDHHKVTVDNSAKLSFSYTPIVFGPAAAPGAAPTDHAQPIVATKSGLLGGGSGRSHSGTISLGVVKAPVDVARVASIFLMALVLGAAAIAARMHRRHLRGGELEAIEGRYKRYLVSTPEIPTVPGRAVVEVDSMNVLVRMAEAQSEVILHASGPGFEQFAVVTDSAVYRYGTAGPRRQPRPARIAAA
jgi:signal peptidase I